MKQTIKNSQNTVKRLKVGQRLHKILAIPAPSSATPTTQRHQTAKGFDSLKEWRNHVHNFRKRFHAARERENPRKRHQSDTLSESSSSSSSSEEEGEEDIDNNSQHSHHQHSRHHHSHHHPVSFATRMAKAEEKASSPIRNSSGNHNRTTVTFNLPATSESGGQQQQQQPQQQHHHHHHNKKKTIKAASLEYQKGTGLLYGSKVCFQSCQMNFLHVNHAKATCTTIAPDANDVNLEEGNIPPTFASRIQILRASDPRDRSQICYGDTVWLNVDANYRHGGDFGDSLEESVKGNFLGTKMIATGDTTGGGSSSKAVPIIQKKTTVRGAEVARWLVVDSKAGHTNDAKGKPVGHLDQIRLELEWSCLGSKGLDVLMTPVSGIANLAKKTMRMSEMGFDHVQQNNVKFNSGWGTSWRVYLSELANDNGGSSSPKIRHHNDQSDKRTKGGSKRRQPVDRGQKLMLHAQTRLLQSRRKRRERGDIKWVREIERQRLEIDDESNDLCALATKDRGSAAASTAIVHGNRISTTGSGRGSNGILTSGVDNVDSMVGSMANFLKARYVVAASEGFSMKARGQFWETVKRNEQQNRVDGEGIGVDSGKYFWETWNKKDDSTSDGGNTSTANSNEIKHVNPTEPLEEGVAAGSESDTEWPNQKLSKVERAKALANAARLEAKIKSSVWQVVGRHRTFLKQEEDHSLLIAVTALQRAVKAWLKSRWKRRFTAVDEDIVIDLKKEKDKALQENENKVQKLKNLQLGKNLLGTNNGGQINDPATGWKSTVKGAKSKRVVPVHRLVPSRTLRWSMESVRKREEERKKLMEAEERERKNRLNEFGKKGSAETSDKATHGSSELKKGSSVDRIHPQLKMALEQTPESSTVKEGEHLTGATISTSLPKQQPPPEMLNLGASLWASSLNQTLDGNAVGGDSSSVLNDGSDAEKVRNPFVLNDSSSVLERASGVTRRPKSSYLRRLKLLPPSEIGGPEDEEMEAVASTTTSMLQGSSMSMNNSMNDSLANSVNSSNMSSNHDADMNRVGMVGMESILESVGGGVGVLGRGVGVLGRGVDDVGTTVKVEGGKKGRKEMYKSRSSHVVRGRPKSAVGRRNRMSYGQKQPQKRRGTGSSSGRRQMKQRPSSAINSSNRKGRAAVRDTRRMLSGLSLETSSKFASTKRSQSSFAAKLQQSIVRGRRSQSVGLL
jgi:hypothetical protein